MNHAFLIISLLFFLEQTESDNVSKLRPMDKAHYTNSSWALI